MAESEGFEPPDGCPSTVFKTAAFDHSASSPEKLIVVYLYNSNFPRTRGYYRRSTRPIYGARPSGQLTLFAVPICSIQIGRPLSDVHGCTNVAVAMDGQERPALQINRIVCPPLPR